MVCCGFAWSYSRFSCYCEYISLLFRAQEVAVIFILVLLILMSKIYNKSGESLQNIKT